MQPACSQRAEIQTYSAPKHNAVDSLVGLQALSETGGLTFDKPEGWVQGHTGGMRKAAFRVQADGREVEVTVVDLAASAGDLLPNVNRWRRQIQLGDTTQQELDKQIEKIRLGGVEAAYVELVGPPGADRREAILGAVAIHQGKAWFFKLKGDAELAQREKEHFRAFLKSVAFGAKDGAPDGR